VCPITTATIEKWEGEGNQSIAFFYVRNTRGYM